MSQPCTWNGIRHESTTAAAEHEGITYDAMHQRLKKGYTCDADMERGPLPHTAQHIPDIRRTTPVAVDAVAGNPDKYPLLISPSGYRVLNIIERELYRRGVVYGVRLATGRAARAEVMRPGDHLRHITPPTGRAISTVLFGVRLGERRYVVLSHEDPHHRHEITGYATLMRVRRYLQKNTTAIYTGELA